MDHDYKKWNKYTIGEIPWINSRREHSSRAPYIKHILDNDIKNVLEIGGGELIEAQKIREHRSDINYKILDVSVTFLKYANRKNFKCYKAEMHNTGFKNKEFDIIYMASVLEHSPNLRKTFEELKRISKQFYFTMFKWKIKDGGLRSVYINKRKYFSTEFNINKLLKLLSEFGKVNNMFICTLDNKIVDYDEYMKFISPGINKHRNGNYLSIKGEWYD